MKHVFVAFIRAYQLFLSPLFPPSCRYTPSCSRYGIEAIQRYGAIRGGWLALRRLLRCHPWGGAGYDPVPPPDAPSSSGGKNPESGASGDSTAHPLECLDMDALYRHLHPRSFV